MSAVPTQTMALTTRAASVRQSSPAETPGALPAVDAQLCRTVDALSDGNPDFWTFANGAKREDAHGFYQYPAMMVPAMQRELLGAIVGIQAGVQSCLDPFAGSGTVLSEAMYFGLAACGQDINPLAALLCRAKAGPFKPDELERRARSLLARADADHSNAIAVSFPGRDKWFRRSASIQLSRLRRAIQDEERLWARRIFWVTLAETIRLTSNSRTSTYKLHVRPPGELGSVPLPRQVFGELLSRNVGRHCSFANALDEAGYLDSGAYRSRVDCRLRDSRLPIEGLFDVMVTSPPYGDNVSTVPYGQSSFLSLQWIDCADIGPEAGAQWVATTHEIDTRSLGGVRPRGDILEMSKELRERSRSLHGALVTLADQPHDRGARVFAFARDLDACVEPILAALRGNGYLVWTVGNRRVGGAQVPLDQVLIELLMARGAVLVKTLERRIPSKRMATRNRIASTMRTERTIVFRKPAPIPTQAPR